MLHLPKVHLDVEPFLEQVLKQSCLHNPQILGITETAFLCNCLAKHDKIFIFKCMERKQFQFQKYQTP